MSAADLLKHRAFWSEEATLVRISENGTARTLVAEGTLLNIINRVAGIHVSQWAQLLVSMPDRSTPPYRFQPKQFAGLVLDSEIRSQSTA